MRLISYRLPDDGPGDAIRVGIALPGSSGADSSATVRPRIVPLADLAGRAAGRTALGPETASLDLRGLLRADPGLQSTRAALATAVGAGVATLPLDDLRLAAPIPDPGKIVCVGHNYAAHVREQGLPMPDRPMLFAKFGNAIVADGEPVIRHAWTHALDLEAELAVVIGRRMCRVAPEEALAHVAGYTVANDISARDLQGSRPALGPGERGDGQWLRAKGSDTFCPLGPVLVTPDEIPDPGHLRLRSWRVVASGPAVGDDPGAAPAIVLMQDANTDDMVFDVPRLLAFVSAVISLEPGDVVLTGTPSGVGVFRDPPVFLEPGDIAVVDAEGIGRLANPIVDDDGSVPARSPAARMLAGDRPVVA